MSKKRTKYLREGNHVAEVDVERIEVESEWSPYLSLEDARKLDVIRAALRAEDLEQATALAKACTLTPVRH